MKYLKNIFYLVFFFILFLLNYQYIGEKPLHYMIVDNVHKEQILTPNDRRIYGVASHQPYLLTVSSFSNGSALIVGVDQNAVQVKVGETKTLFDSDNRNYIEKVQLISADEKSAKVVVDYYNGKKSDVQTINHFFGILLNILFAFIEETSILIVIEWIKDSIEFIRNRTSSN